MSDKVDSSDEEAPESISFGKSRETALTVLKEAAEFSKSISHKQKKTKDEKKKRRQERKDEKLKSENINENLEKLNNLREKAKEALCDKTQPDEKVPKSKAVPNKKKVFLEENEDPSGSDAEISKNFIPFNASKMKSKRTSREFKNSGTSTLKVEVVASKKPKVHAADSVLKFRETMLYGAGSRVKRESSKSAIARKEKIKLCGKNVFCNS